MSSCRQSVHVSALCWMVLIGRITCSGGRQMYRMFTPCSLTHTHTHVYSLISSDHASWGIWHAEKKGVLGLYKACWETGSNTGSCSADVKLWNHGDIQAAAEHFTYYSGGVPLSVLADLLCTLQLSGGLAFQAKKTQEGEAQFGSG